LILKCVSLENCFPSSYKRI